jgi:hypothetical protein
MVKCFTSLVMIAILGGSVIAGVPMHVGEQGCSMGEMMDCCELARQQSDTPSVASARLCCAINCSQPGTLMPGGVGRIPLPAAVIPHPATMQLFVPFQSSALHSRETQSFAQGSSPPYIRYLALLI